MSKKGKLVCNGAECKCKFGNAPDKLIVQTQTKRYINDPEGAEKLIATHKETGQPFEAKTFGSCKMQPTASGYKPCQPAVTEWQNFHDKITLVENGGNPLLESSKATCAIAGTPCISIEYHGQTGKPVAQNFAQEENEEDTACQINPLVNTNEVLQPIAVASIKGTKL